MTRGRQLAIWALAATLAAAAAALHWWVVAPIPPGRGHWAAVPVLVAAGFAAAELNTVYVRLGREAYAFSLMEFPLVIGVFFVRPDLLVLCRLAGAAVAYLWQRKAIQKAVFNCALFALETDVAVALWHAVADPTDPADGLGPWVWLATGLAVLATSLLGSAMVSVVIAIATGALPASVREVFSLGQVGDLANACFALVAVYILEADWRAGWLLGVVTAVIVVAYRSSERARARSENLAQLNRFIEVVGRAGNLEDVAGAVLREVREAFGVGVVQLRFADADGTVHEWVLDQELPESRSAALLDLLPHADDQPLLVARRGTEPTLETAARRAGVRDCLRVPVLSETGSVGSLVAADMLGDVATFTPADIGRLQALANHAAVALENAARARLIERQGEEREHRALHDEMTGLANRRLFGVELAEALASGRAAVLLLDLDRFKEVNDTLGHETGDRLLALVAGRLCSVVPDGAMVARFGGDEFAVLLPGSGEEEARACGEAVRESLAGAVDLDGVAVAVDASVGAAVGERGDDGVNLVRGADVAMYAAKERRSGLELHRPDMDSGDTSRLGLLADLRVAVASAGIDVWYQPQVDVSSGALVGAEALARWSRPGHGAITPEEFIPLAERSSLITPLTMHVLRTALGNCASWRRLVPGFAVAVNISPRSLLHERFVEDIARELARFDVPADCLTLEITETSLMADPDRAVGALDRLAGLGVRLSVDDLGTGYSSLAYLRRLPVDEVKIDRSFLQDLRDPSAEAVVGAVVDLGHRLGRYVVAEGVEDQWAFHRLRDLGCDRAQGYWLARPMPAADLTELASSWQPVDAPLRVVP